MPLEILSSYDTNQQTYSGTQAGAQQELAKLQNYLQGNFGIKSGRLKLVDNKDGSFYLARRSWSEFFLE